MNQKNILQFLTGSRSKTYVPPNLPFKTLYTKFIEKANKRVISFSVYGEKNVYLLGALKNIEIAAQVYPDWVCRFYCDQKISNLNEIKAAAEKGLCEVIVVDSPIFPMYWRYFSADDPNIDFVIFRDTDSLVNYREKSAVEDWVNSGKTMHTMHDNDAGHWSPVMGGMCGLKLPINFEMHNQIDLWAKNLRNYKFHYSDDQTFLSKKVLPLFENSLIDHHNNPSRSKFKHSVPYPEHKEIGFGSFVGDRITAFGFMKDEFSKIQSDNVFLVSHLGPTDHYAIRDAIQAAINKYKEVVIPVKKPAELLVNYMFGGYDSVIIKVIGSDEEAFDLYQKHYSSHKFIGFGSHGDHVAGMGWGAKLCFSQLGLPFESGLFKRKSSRKFSYESLNQSYVNSLGAESLPSSSFNFNLEIKNEPKVTVVIPTYNRFKYLLNSLNSIKEQSYKNYEVIIANDASTQQEYYNYNFKENYGDNFHVMHLPKNSRSIYGKVAGGGHARNISMMLSQGEYISFLDDDDQFLPEKLEYQVKVCEQLNKKMSCTEALIGTGPMQKNTQYSNWHHEGAYWGSIKNVFNRSGKQENFERMFKDNVNIWNKEDLETHNCCICSSVMIHRSMMEKAGYFPLLSYAEDWAYWKKIIQHTDCAYIRKPLIYMDSSHGDGQHWT